MVSRLPVIGALLRATPPLTVSTLELNRHPAHPSLDGCGGWFWTWRANANRSASAEQAELPATCHGLNPVGRPELDASRSDEVHRGRRPGGVADRTARDADPLDQELDELPALLGGRPLYVIGLPLLYTFLLTTVLAGLSNVLPIWALPGEMGGDSSSRQVPSSSWSRISPPTGASGSVVAAADNAPRTQECRETRDASCGGS